MSIYVQLIHGRHTPDEELDDWGFNGPILGPFPWFQMTYGCDIKLGDDGIIVMDKHIDLTVPDNEGLMQFLGGYYGDMSIVSEDTIQSSPDLLKRWQDTCTAFQYMMEEIPTHINDAEEWIKVFAQFVMRGDLHDNTDA
jgi:hypothetical protein